VSKQADSPPNVGDPQIRSWENLLASIPRLPHHLNGLLLLKRVASLPRNIEEFIWKELIHHIMALLRGFPGRKGSLLRPGLLLYALDRLRQVLDTRASCMESYNPTRQDRCARRRILTHPIQLNAWKMARAIYHFAGRPYICQWSFLNRRMTHK